MTGRRGRRRKQLLDWSHLAYKLPSKTRYRRKLRRKDRMTGRRGRRRKQLLDDVKENRRYCKLKEEALDRTL
jgi:hypothetical protein